MTCSNCGHVVRAGHPDKSTPKTWHIYVHTKGDQHGAYCGRRKGVYKDFDIEVSKKGPHADMCEACWIELNKQMPQAHVILHRAWVEEGKEPLFLFTEPVPRLAAIQRKGLTPIGRSGMPLEKSNATR